MSTRRLNSAQICNILEDLGSSADEDFSSDDILEDPDYNEDKASVHSEIESTDNDNENENSAILPSTSSKNRHQWKTNITWKKNNLLLNENQLAF